MSTFSCFFRPIALVVALACMGQARAAEFSIGPRGYGVSIEGEIKPGDFKRFNAFIIDRFLKHTEVDYGSVFLNSRGGSVEEALKFANLFSKSLSLVAVMRGNSCLSACTIIWAGGADRMLDRDAKLGFHRLSFTQKNVDVRKTKSKTDSENKKITNFFREVGFPTLLIDKMNETPPSDIYIVDNRWLIEHELDRAVAYQPAFLDVVEKQCGVDPSMASYKQNRLGTPSEIEAYKTWLTCADGVKTANREIAFNDLVRDMNDQAKELSRVKSMVAHTKWTLAGDTDGDTVYFDKKSAKWSGRIVKLWVIFNFKLKGSSSFSSLDYLTIDCDTGTVAATDGSSTNCDGEMCETPRATIPNEPTIAKKPADGSTNAMTVNAVCNKK